MSTPSRPGAARPRLPAPRPAPDRPAPAGLPAYASLRAAYRAETARLTRWIRTRASWLTASLPRIGGL